MNAAGTPPHTTPSDSAYRIPFALEHVGNKSHTVQFYSQDEKLVLGVARSVGASLVAGDSAVIVATPGHRQSLTELFQAGGLNIDLAIKEGRYVALDASCTLAEIVVDGLPVRERFLELMSGVLTAAKRAGRGSDARVLVFGEMVALLASSGNFNAALRLEELWNELSQSHDFHLHCAYPIGLFSGSSDGDCLARICDAHHQVTPTESYTDLTTEKDRSAAIALLQQKSLVLETEIKQREKAQRDAQEREAELRDFVENAVVAIHWVGADGRILWANKAELNLLGYEPEEYIGHHVAEFHVDANSINDILQRLGRQEELRGYRSRLRCKDGSIRYVHIHSNVQCADGKFQHTRCFTIDVTQAYLDELRIAAQHEELQRSQAQLQELYHRLQEEFATMERIQQLSSRWVQISDFNELLNEVLDAALDVSHADMGHVQLLDGKVLKLAAHRDCPPEFLRYFNEVANTHSACGLALTTGQRVIVEDVDASPVFADSQTRDIMRTADVRAVQSTPLVSHSGRVLGMFSTHYRVPRRPTEQELRAMDVLARFGADLIERKQAEDALRHSEQRFRVITEASPIMVWMSGLDKLCYYFNKVWLEFVGRTLEQEAGNGWAENVHPDDFDRCLQIYATNFDARRPFEMEYRLRHHSGQYRWIHDCGVPRFAPDGAFEGYVGGCLDIHDQKEAATVKAKLAAIVESSNDAIVSKDLNGIVTSWNHRAEKMFGYTAEEIIGKPITTIIPPELQSDEEMILGKIRTGQRIDHYETVRVSKSGERIDVSLSISPVRDELGNIVGAAKIARDITERKQVELALRVSEKLAAAGRLAATVAHEINNPLESVTNYVYLAKTTPGVPAELRTYLDFADQELSRVSHIARQTLGFYRDNARPTWLDVAKVVDDIATVYQRKLINKSIALHRIIDSDLQVFAVEGELKQVLSNLLSNAIEATDEGGKIRISARRVSGSGDKQFIRLIVADSGEGIAVEHRARLFDPFYTTKKDVGTGLGLWITKELVQKAGGRIRLRSRVGEHSGTAVAIVLPSDTETASAQVA